MSTDSAVADADWTVLDGERFREDDASMLRPGPCGQPIRRISFDTDGLVFRLAGHGAQLVMAGTRDDELVVRLGDLTDGTVIERRVALPSSVGTSWISPSPAGDRALVTTNPSSRVLWVELGADSEAVAEVIPLSTEHTWRAVAWTASGLVMVTETSSGTPQLLWIRGSTAEVTPLSVPSGTRAYAITNDGTADDPVLVAYGAAGASASRLSWGSAPPAGSWVPIWSDESFAATVTAVGTQSAVALVDDTLVHALWLGPSLAVGDRHDVSFPGATRAVAVGDNLSPALFILDLASGGAVVYGTPSSGGLIDPETVLEGGGSGSGELAAWETADRSRIVARQTTWSQIDAIILCGAGS